MKQSEIKELSTAELQEKLSDTKKTYVDLKMTHAISPLENPIHGVGVGDFNNDGLQDLFFAGNMVARTSVYFA